ncbi:MAG TPA: DivIVA domain-containing protein [Clostridiales bacterium]|jgi:cell division initiation protein|nr:DivIVA domain-containing protein [Clostridiales bacterium]
MITPQDIRNRCFSKAVFGGYDMGAVDEFIDNIAEDYESLYKENAALKSKLKVLVEKVEEYRSTEEAMRMALLAAKKMADEMVEEAKSKTEAMLREKEAEAAMKLAEIRSKIQDEENRMKAAQQVTADFVDMSMGLCRKHLTFLQKLGELKIDENPFKEPEPQNDRGVGEAAKAIEDSVTKIFGDVGRSSSSDESFDE